MTRDLFPDSGLGGPVRMSPSLPVRHDVPRLVTCSPTQDWKVPLLPVRHCFPSTPGPNPAPLPSSSTRRPPGPTLSLLPVHPWTSLLPVHPWTEPRSPQPNMVFPSSPDLSQRSTTKLPPQLKFPPGPSQRLAITLTALNPRQETTPRLSSSF